ncbi:hypothetical protein [Mesorhizobium sp. B2-4-5]|uniref:hypothetical protein n=1 Tax=Mesorhizobium sp. B2-4-5 TaxID=2589944 RepID=UPI00112C5E05|nr:hypothetical protein [Mesorhizobium sp. B2-4-5]TPL42592.1 hypothetical protein FJ961_07840 [Mesorhizobium sp. B2-4-5]
MHIKAQINHARRHACFSASALRKAGYRQIGRGAFSTAFVHPDAPDVVVKVGKHYNGRIGLADGFPFFAQQLLDKEISSKFFPKIYALQWDDTKTSFWCVMRRYAKVPRAERITTSANIAATLRKVSGGTIHDGGRPTARYRKAVEQLVDYRFVSDIHAGNVMRDHEGTPIIIDPICITPRFRQEFYA